MVIDPVTLTLLDGRTLELRPSFGLIRRSLLRCGVKSVQKLFEQEAETAVGIVLYEALPADLRQQMTEEQFYDLLPADLQSLTRTVVRLLGGDPDRPLTAQPETTAQETSTG